MKADLPLAERRRVDAECQREIRSFVATSLSQKTGEQSTLPATLLR